jgi:hypothetical protein
MGALDVIDARETSGAGVLSVVRCALTGAVAFALFFPVGWIAAGMIQFGAAAFLRGLAEHWSLGLVSVLAVHALYSSVAGAVFGGVIAVVYNALKFVARW